MRKKAVLLLFPLALVWLSGCGYLVAAGAGAAVGVGTYTYIKGELKVEYPYPYERVWEVTVLALEDSGIAIGEKVRDAFGGQIKGRRANGDQVRVIVKKKGAKMTLVRIRVGIFGDEGVSLMIKEAIDRRLRG